MPLASQGVQAWDRYAYVNNNPVRYNDPSGHWIETAFDVISLGLSLNDVRTQGLNFWTGLAVVTDVASIAIPVVPAGASHAIRAAKWGANAANAADSLADSTKAVNAVDGIVDVGDEATEGLIRLVRQDQVGTSQPFKLRKGEDGLSVFEGVTLDEVLEAFPGNQVPNTTVTIPKDKLPPGTQIIPKIDPNLSQRLSEAHRILVRPEEWSADRFAKALKALVGWE